MIQIIDITDLYQICDSCHCNNDVKEIAAMGDLTNHFKKSIKLCKHCREVLKNKLD